MVSWEEALSVTVKVANSGPTVPSITGGALAIEILGAVVVGVVYVKYVWA
jgi:hypothetical protein